MNLNPNQINLFQDFLYKESEHIYDRLLNILSNSSYNYKFIS